jgi:hypothetical protein
MGLGLIVKSHKKLMRGFAARFPDLYRQYVERGNLLEPAKQEELSKLDEVAFFNYLMQRDISDHLCIYPEYTSAVMKDLSDEIFKGLKTMKEVTLRHLPAMREQLGSRAHLIALKEFDGLFTQEPRKEGAAMMTGKLEYRVAQSECVPGPHFFTTTTGGYHGFLKFYEEEIGKIAPVEANAYLLGAGWCVTVSGGMADSPILLEDTRKVPLKDDIYHVVPIKFFNAHPDTSAKFDIDIVVDERDDSGTATRYHYDLKKRTE